MGQKVENISIKILIMKFCQLCINYMVIHWDGIFLLFQAIVGYRETEKKEWNERNKAVLQRVRTLAFAPDVEQLAYVHVLDVMAAGVIKQHIDSTRVSWTQTFMTHLHNSLS